MFSGLFVSYAGAMAAMLSCDLRICALGIFIEKGPFFVFTLKGPRKSSWETPPPRIVNKKGNPPPLRGPFLVEKKAPFR